MTRLFQVASNQIKSNHFYCHITTAQVPWWVKFLWACSRQCKKTTTTIYIWTDSAKKTTDNLPMDRQCKKNNRQFTYGQTVQKTTTTIYIWTDSAKNNNNNLHMDRQCKKNNKQFTYGQTVQKKTTNNLHMDRQCKKKQQTIYIWTDSAKKKKKPFTYGQTVQKSCTGAFTVLQTVQKNNNNLHMDSTYLQTIQKTVCKIHVHIVYYKDILNYQRHIIHRMGTSTLCTLSIHNVVYT